jgi:hypothetical protein
MIQREAYLRKIRPFIDTPVMKVLTGMRRCGKTVLLELIKLDLGKMGVDPSRMLSMNFESALEPYTVSRQAAYAHIRDSVAKAKGRLYLFLDEVQELDDWEKLVNSCLVDFDADIYLTGSNAKMLSGELATYLGGRYVEIKVFPFSFREVFEWSQEGQRGQFGQEPLAKEEAFLKYLVLGGMPFLYQHSIDVVSARQYLSDIFDSTIIKDIAQRNKVRDIDQLRRLILFFIANAGNTFSSASVIRYLKNEKRSLSTETLYNYIRYCMDSCLIHLVPREDLLGKKLLSFQEKIYLTDHGIRQAIYGSNMRDISQTLENVVYMELIRRGYDVRVGKTGASEVDFSATRGSEKLYIQVAYLLADDATIEREFSSLESIPDNFPKLVLSMDAVDRSRNGIIHKNIKDFLLEGD